MDLRTNQLLSALDAPSVEILLALLKQSLPESDLLARIPDLKQSQVNKKLKRLAEVGLIRRPGSTRRGGQWEISAREPTRDLLSALLALSEALDSEDRSRRDVARDGLERSAKLIYLPTADERQVS